MKDLPKSQKNICAKRRFWFPPKRTAQKLLKPYGFRGFFFRRNDRFSPERAVIRAKSQQFEGVSL